MRSSRNVEMLRRGRKFNRNHPRSIVAARKILAAAKKLREVGKVTVGIVQECTTSAERLSLHTIPDGVRAVVESRGERQAIQIHTDKPDDVMRNLRLAWKSK